MADVTELRMNVAALKRVDPYVKEILETATHVALYTFNGEINEWERTDVEGALFVYSRSGEPFHGILIMNRLNTNNLLEPVIPGLELQLQEPFLLYRNTRARIFGIWFYDKDECIKIASMLDKLVRRMNLQRKNMDITSKTRSNGCSGPDVDIFSMLNKAQEDYNSNKVLGENNSGSDILPHSLKKDDAPPQSVMDFFAKASGTASHFVSEKSASQLPGIYIDPKQHASLLPEAGNNDQLKPFLQRLMSNPAHSVEHIEMKQRSVTPHAETSRSKVSQQSEGVKSNGLNVRHFSSGDVADSVNRSVPYDGSQSDKVFSEQQNHKVSVENNMSFLRISSPVPTVPQVSTLFGSSAQTGTSSAVVLENAAPDQRPLSAPLCCRVETPAKPALMPPTMFTSSASKNCLSGEMNSKLHSSTLLPTCGSMNESCDTLRVEPLTKNQLIQAFNYLLKNDPDFVNKLHEAYVKSIAEMVR
ncbi:mRNA-decapping enzyme 1B [Anabrus simplex]|uniref:mRNA-decapping enzyme 1B n=1 Tax=Anabrus simplex TaxID=316456 RepID=UPI0034DD6105